MVNQLTFLLAPILLTNLFKPSHGQNIPAMFSDNKCINCGITNSEAFRVAVIKAEILRRLGIQQPPLSHQTPPPIPIRLPEPVQRDHSDLSERGYELSDILSYSESPDNFTDENIIQFKLATDHNNRRLYVQSASLLVRIRYRQRNKKQRPGGTKSNRNKKRNRKQKLVDLVVSTVNAEGKPDEVITSVKSTMRKTKWLRLTLPQEQVQKAIESTNGTLQVYISCVGCGRRARPILVHRRRRKRGLKTGTKPKLHKRRPMLFLHTRVTTGSRTRRSTHVRECTEKTGDNCCKSTFKVDFESFGWRHWILSPKRYRTAFCDGVCIDTEARQVHRGNSSATEVNAAVTSPTTEIGNLTMTSSQKSCVPVRLRPLRLVYYNEEGVILQGLLPNMIVSKCGCR